MNITIVGSANKKTNSRILHEDKFGTACEAIGKKLAESGHKLIVSHADKPTTAEYHALKGFKSVNSNNYYPCYKKSGDAELKAHLDAVEMSEVVILIGGNNGTYASGLSALRRRKLIIPIPTFGGSAMDLCEFPEIDKTVDNEIRNLDVEKPEWTEVLTNAINLKLDGYPRILIIHGRGDSGKKLKERIEEESRKSTSELNKLSGVQAPLIMDLKGMGALSVPNVFEKYASKVAAAIAIITADDIGGFARSDGREYSARELKLEPRARENVWVEVGWFWGRLGRERVFLWLVDKVKLPSDLQGAAWTYADKLWDDDEKKGAWESIEAFMLGLRTPSENM